MNGCPACCDSCSRSGKTAESVVFLAIRLILSATAFGAAYALSESLFLFVVSFALAGGDIVRRAASNILKGKVFDENFLMSVATVGAFIMGDHPEGAAVMLFFQAGEILQNLSVERSKKAISSLMNIRPDYAVIPGGKRVPPESVGIGDTIIVKPGERIPLDGKIIEGSAAVDTSALSGEALPRDVSIGEDVLSGWVNMSGVLTIEVTKLYGDSTVAKILELTQNAADRKAKTEAFITRFAKGYTPAVTLLAAAMAVLVPPILGEPFSPWIHRALVFLVISCPCALVVSIPLGFFGGIGRASKRGILVKGANYLEALRSVETVVFDKTGTLTQGTFKVTEINAKVENLLELAAYAEHYSGHPIARSVVKEYGKEIDESRISDYTEIAGKGIKAVIDQRPVVAGNADFVEGAEATPYAAVHISIDGEYAGHIAVEDELKPDSKAAIQKLKSAGIKKTVILTGDNGYSAKKTAEQVGVDEVYFNLLPGDKVSKLEEIKKSGAVAFVGDGINDAPVLAIADVGIAMGGMGSDAAIEAADVIIMTDEPSKIAEAIDVGRLTRRVVWQNIVFALGTKGIVMLLAVFGIASMWYAVFADVGVALLAVMNSMRLIKGKQ
ncbi:MAG: Cadmium, zinc and cobalt-transporting ATPase [Firmicutes bacterium ADurb.Bin193]|nr:MAG: Cadmium, zinc and cobalt-transporting ATPase [Firmicutes bacterium ADurb.Bin193]